MMVPPRCALTPADCRELLLRVLKGGAAATRRRAGAVSLRLRRPARQLPATQACSVTI